MSTPSSRIAPMKIPNPTPSATMITMPANIIKVMEASAQGQLQQKLPSQCNVRNYACKIMYQMLNSLNISVLQVKY